MEAIDRKTNIDSKHRWGRLILQTAVILIVLIFSIASLLSISAYLIKEPNRPYFIEYYLDHILPFFSTIPGDLTSLTAGTIPALVAIVCYNRKTLTINLTGKLASVIAAVGLISSFSCMIIFNNDETNSLSSVGSNQTIKNIYESNEITVRTLAFYLAMLLGIGHFHSGDNQ